MTEIEVTTSPSMAPAQFESVGVEQLISTFLSGKSACTIRCYESDLHGFRKFLKVPTLPNAINSLLNRPLCAMNLLVLQYRASMERSELSKSAINRALSALRSIVGVVSGRTISVPNFRTVSYRDCSGSGQDGFKALLATAETQRPEKASRDVAILWLLCNSALSRNEVATLEMEHVKIDEATILVPCKGRSARIPLPIQIQTVDAIRKWLAFRGGEPGRLFYRVDQAAGNGAKRLSSNGIFRIVRALANRTGGTFRPIEFPVSEARQATAS